MVMTIIIIAVIALGVFLVQKFEHNWDWDGLVVVGWILGIIGVIWLFCHFLTISLRSHDYNILVVEREALQNSLDISRENNATEFERVSIFQDIKEFNVRLAKEKYNNTTFLLDVYTDDRIDNVEPIK